MKKIMLYITAATGIAMFLCANACSDQFSAPVKGGWNMASLWFSTDTLFAQLTDAGLTLYKYDSVSGDYSEVASNGELERGKSYWVKAPSVGSVNVEADGYAAGSHSVSVTTGWNMLGNPFAERLNISEIDLNGTPLPVASPYTLSSQPGIYYAADSYSLAGTYLEPGEGFWLYADAGGSVTYDQPATSGLTANAGDDVRCVISIYHNAVLVDGILTFEPVNSNCTLSGNADGGSGAYTYSWEQISGPPVTLDDATAQKPIFTPSMEGAHTFRLTVTEGAETDTDTVTITAVRISGKIVFYSGLEQNHPGSELYVMNADGTGVTRLTNNTADEGWPRWSPDGSKIAFLSERDGDIEVYVMNSDGTNPTRLTNRPGYDALPDWSTDSTRIIFTTDRDGRMQIYQMNADGTNQLPLTSNPSYDSDSSYYSPDGKTILFTREVGFDNYEVFVMDSDGNNERRLTDDVFVHFFVGWTPDGKILYSQSDCLGCKVSLYVMNMDGSMKEQLTLPQGVNDFKSPVMTDDGKYIFYKASDSFISVMCADGSCNARVGYQASSPDYHPGQ